MPADIPHKAPAIAGRVGNARTAISVAITMNGAPMAIGPDHALGPVLPLSPGAARPLALAAFVSSVITPTSITVSTRGERERSPRHVAAGHRFAEAEREQPQAEHRLQAGAPQVRSGV